MILSGVLSFVCVILSVGAAKDGGDDDWVHLPNKCEGKNESLNGVSFQEQDRAPCLEPRLNRKMLNMTAVLMQLLAMSKH